MGQYMKKISIFDYFTNRWWITNIGGFLFSDLGGIEFDKSYRGYKLEFWGDCWTKSRRPHLPLGGTIKVCDNG